LVYQKKVIEKLIDTKGAGHAQKSEGTVTTDSKGVQEYNPVAFELQTLHLTGRGAKK